MIGGDIMEDHQQFFSGFGPQAKAIVAMKSYKSAALYSDKPNKWAYQVVKKYLSLHTQNIPFGCVYKLRILVLIWVFRTIWYLVTGHESIWGWPKLNIYPQNWMVHSEIR
jgi:hypothetical protein